MRNTEFNCVLLVKRPTAIGETLISGGGGGSDESDSSDEDDQQGSIRASPNPGEYLV